MYYPMPVIGDPLNQIIKASDGLGALYLGNIESAGNGKLLSHHGIGAVLSVMSNKEFSYGPHIAHKFIRVDDADYVNLSAYFKEAIEFIEQQRRTTNVLVHCHAGISRSATIVLAYLMQNHRFSLNKAFQIVSRERRIINPNPGFMRQLQAFEASIGRGNTPRKNNDLRQSVYLEKEVDRQYDQRYMPQRNYHSTADMLRQSYVAPNHMRPSARPEPYIPQHQTPYVRNYSVPYSSSAKLYVWGNSLFGQLGVGEKYIGQLLSEPKKCSFRIVVDKVACGGGHSCVISGGILYAMGNNEYQQIDQSQVLVPYPVQVSQQEEFIEIQVGSNYTIAINAQQQAFYWGAGSYLKMLSVTQVQQISCGARHFGLISQNILHLFGDNEKGQLGCSGSAKCHKLHKYPVNAVACGLEHTLLLSQSSLYSFGCNQYGQLGTGNRIGGSQLQFVMDEVELIEASDFSAAISNSKLFVWGSGVFGEFFVPTELEFDEQITQLKLGIGFGIILDDHQQVYSFGKNSSGQLAQKDFVSILHNYQAPRSHIHHIRSLKNKNIKSIHVGDDFVICLSETQVTDVETLKMQNLEYKQKIQALESKLNNTITVCKSIDLEGLQEQLDLKNQIIHEQEITLFKLQKTIQDEQAYYSKLLQDKDKQISILNDNVRKLERIVKKDYSDQWNIK